MKYVKWSIVIVITAVACLVVLRLVAGEPVAATKPAFFVDLRTPQNIAHRGASGERAEHSWAAYDLALKEGADILELDVRMTKDQVIVVAHDANIGRITGTPLAINTSTLAELQEAGGVKAPLPLADVLARYPTRFNIEIKEDRPEVATRLAELLHTMNREQTVLVASFRTDVLEAFRAASHGVVATSAHSREVVEFLVRYGLGLPARPDYAALQIPRRVGKYLNLGSASFIRFAHQHGLVVQYWTIDVAADMRELLQVGADGIMTNFPAALERELCTLRATQAASTSATDCGAK